MKKKTAVIKEVAIKDIRVGQRVRQDFGDITDLADSIDALGLIHPISVDKELNLLAGESRLRAARHLGWDSITVIVRDGDSPAAIEHAENAYRKNLTISERVAQAEKVLSEARERRKHSGSKRRVANLPPSKKHEKTRDAAAKLAGFTSTTTFRNAQRVVERGIPKLVKWMNEGFLAPSVCASLAELPAAKQREAVNATPTDAKRWIKEFAGLHVQVEMGQMNIFGTAFDQELRVLLGRPIKTAGRELEDVLARQARAVQKLAGGQSARDLTFICERRTHIAEARKASLARHYRELAVRLAAAAKALETN